MLQNAVISDLFFNLDHTEAEAPKDHNAMFAGYDEAKLYDQAIWFADCMAMLGVKGLEARAIIKDFKARL